MKKATVLITGASGGIGEEFARIFARNGFDLVLVARQGDKLQELARKFSDQFKTETFVLPVDLVQRASPEHIFETLKTKNIQVEVLVNNAGFGEYGHFEEISLQRQLDMMQLNMTAVVHLSKLFLEQLSPTAEGKILNVASTAAFQPGPLMAVYFATKAFVLSFSEAIANELKARRVTVTALCPGPTATDFEKQANLGGSDLFAGKIATPQEVAEAGYEGLMAGKTVVIPGIKNKVLALSSRFAPRDLVTRIVRFMQEKR
ncbi:SDR family oxidoreductase [Adhaeribacter sp. BT258]|uniref:SDR family oxidoreductase n=1 Tax=Adhaeribacter terrigena TaxID=2793070 RepID=A0ABS1C515_9BACT|nr:SDR family oxidoreductase [Adhaeribacter terrigena]MBK0404479.1 SDR family oxidoreductase [Adhaeribacter terrigena]